MEPLNPPLLARTRRNGLFPWKLPEEYDEEESVDLSSDYDIFATTNFIVANSFRVAPDDSSSDDSSSDDSSSDYSSSERRPEVWDRDTKFLSVSDQILYLDNRNLIVLDYKPTYENNKP